MIAESDIRLKACFLDVGKHYGFDDVNAEFLELRDFKVKWQRTYRFIDFKVSDYLRDAPETILRELADFVYKKIRGEDAVYSDGLYSWLTSPNFSISKQRMYLERSLNLSDSVVGRSKNLEEAYNRLIGAELVQYDPSIVFRWTNVPTRKAANTSVLMKVVSMSSGLDSDDVPDFVLDYCLYHELCHLAIGFDPTGGLHDEKFYCMDNRFPAKSAALQWIGRLSMYV